MSQPNILIAECPFLSQQMLAASLKSLGYQKLLIATNNDETIELVKSEKEISILICPLTSPTMQELSVIHEAHHFGRIDAIILISDTNLDIRLALAQLSRHAGFQLLGILRRQFSKNDLQTALANYSPKHPLRVDIPLIEMPSSNCIEKAVQNGELVPFYQPQLNLKTMKVVGAEILMRWHHPELGLIGPAAFLEIATHFDQLSTMTLSILEQALNFIRSQSFAEDFKLSINIDAAQLKDPSLHKHIAQLTATAKFNPANLIVEITETGMLEAPAVCLENLIHLRMLGCGISIDDFGTGFSSLQRICELPCTEIKLDMSFTNALLTNHRSVAAVDTMTKFSNTIGVQLVAEGIETKEQLQLLQGLGCHIGQGYLFSPPISAEQLKLWIAQRKPEHLLKTS
ncbi:EAL domain-containing protein (putative c-di-GMP-specific phosphodiesterase class I)/CheY-like chemotaxis protein [Pseudomonas sp. TE3786]